MFTIDDDPQFTCDAAVVLGPAEPRPLRTVFRALPDSEMQSLRDGSETDREFLARVVVRFEDLVDDDGAPLTCDDALRERLLDRAWVRSAVMRAYFEQMVPRRSGN